MPISRSRARKYAPFAATAGRASRRGAARNFALAGALSSTATTCPPWLAYCQATRYSNGPVPAKTTREFIALAKAKPGSLNFASLGAATTQGLAATMFNFMAGVEAVEVPYKGSAPGVTDLLGGNVQFMFNALPSMLHHIQSGKLRALGTTGAKRAPQLPEVPVIKDAVPGYEVTTWYSFVAPAGTPKPAIDRLNREISAIFDTPAVQEKLRVQGLEPDSMTPEELASLFKSETAKWAKVIKDAKIQPE